MTIANVFELLGGLAFFLFGMTLLGDALKRVAGSKLETILGKLTSNTFKGILLGALVTGVIQSSSATTIMVVGFVNSGIMKLSNAIGIIMGANIGTTVTGWVLVLAGVDGGGISSSTIFAFIAFIGIILYFFCKKRAANNVGMILMAFTVLMSGMQSMRGAMELLRESPAFLDFIAAVSNPLLALLIGLIVTAIIQSCSASIGILQALAVTGVIGYDVAIPMVVGMCIGASMPILLSAIGANLNGKRAALIYLYFNIYGAVVLMSLFYLVNSFVHFDIMNETATSMGIAIVNTIFNFATTIALAPMTGIIEKLVTLSVKDKNTTAQSSTLLDERFLKYPPIALEQCGATMDEMINTSFTSLVDSTKLISDYSQEKFDKIMANEDKVDGFEDSLGAYLVRLNTMALSDKETRTVAKYLSCITNVERVSDHAVNLAELAKELSDKNIRFSEKASADLKLLMEATCEILTITGEAAKNDDIELAKKVEPLEQVIDVMTKKMKAQHVARLQAGNCTLELGFVFNECLGNCERVADHCSNIAVSVLEVDDSHVQAHSYLHMIKKGDDENFRALLTSYARKYDIDIEDTQE